MALYRSISEPIRAGATWGERWKGDDAGLIACWERGRELGLEDPALASRAADGQLVPLPWKGGVEKVAAKKQKFGTFYYLAMWQGLRREDLSIDQGREVAVTCSSTGMEVVFTADATKWAGA